MKVNLLAAVLCAATTQVYAAPPALPSDPQSTNCSLSQTEVTQWLASGGSISGGKITKDATFNAADSVGFPQNNTACDFYKWSSQMFLWLTSPSGEVDSGPFVFDSTTFFDVSPENAGGKRTLEPNISYANNYSVRSSKPNAVGELNQQIGEVNQAGQGYSLLSQNGDLLYYGIHVNDMYAAFLTQQSETPPNQRATSFPTTEAEMTSVLNWATAYGMQVKDSNALTLEIKTAWVDASSVTAADFVTIEATVPNYTQGTTEWTANGSTTKTLALVGMHIVGTVNGHPEMVWATIEHITNAPDNTYYYTNTSGTNTEVDFSQNSGWLLMSATGTPSSANNPVAIVEGSNIYGTCINNPSQSPLGPNGCNGKNTPSTTVQNTIAASDTYRVNPWGSAPSVTSSADNNAQLISLNNDVLGFLSSGDVRENYILSGAVWTQHGNLPYYNVPKSGEQPPAFTMKGSLSLANTSMETYNQSTSTAASGTQATNAGCLSCHAVSGVQARNDEGLATSHIYSDIYPLPPYFQLQKK